jgi:hypothetical protein
MQRTADQWAQVPTDEAGDGPRPTQRRGEKFEAAARLKDLRMGMKGTVEAELNTTGAPTVEGTAADSGCAHLWANSVEPAKQ